MKAPAGPVSLAEVEDMLATVAALIRANGEHGLAYLPIFERLERERERMADIDGRLDRALARVKGQPSRSPRATSSDPRCNHSAAA